MQQRPDVQLQRRHEEYRKLSDQVVRLSDNADEQDAHQIGQEGASRFETDFLSDPAKNAPCQVLLGRNGVGKTTILNALFMLAEVIVRALHLSVARLLSVCLVVDSTCFVLMLSQNV